MTSKRRPHWLLPREGQVGNSASSKGREEVEVGAVWLLLFSLNPLFSKYHLSRRDPWKDLSTVGVPHLGLLQPLSQTHPPYPDIHTHTHTHTRYTPLTAMGTQSHKHAHRHAITYTDSQACTLSQTHTPPHQRPPWLTHRHIHRFPPGVWEPT